MSKKQATKTQKKPYSPAIVLRAHTLYALIMAEMHGLMTVGEVLKTVNACAKTYFTTYQVKRELEALKDLGCALVAKVPTRGEKKIAKWFSNESTYVLLTVYQDALCDEYRKSSKEVLKPIQQTADIVRKNCLNPLPSADE